MSGACNVIYDPTLVLLGIGAFCIFLLVVLRFAPPPPSKENRSE